LDQIDLAWRSHRPPGRRCPQPDQFAEHLADLGRGGEVAGDAELVVPGVIAAFRVGKAKLHILRNRHRAADRDAPPDLRLELDNLGHVRGAASFRMAAAIRAMPASINGSDNSMPIVKPPHRKPSWGSGSRKCSQIE